MQIQNAPRRENKNFKKANLLNWIILGCAFTTLNLISPVRNLTANTPEPAWLLSETLTWSSLFPYLTREFPTYPIGSNQTPDSQTDDVPELPGLKEFISAVSDGNSTSVRGVFLPGIFALPIIQQPNDDPMYVSLSAGVITQFKLAADYGITGLLAHNYLSGQEFYKLQPGQDVYVVYGDSKVKHYRIKEIDELQKLEPERLTSNYIDLTTGRWLSGTQVFTRFYRGLPHLTFQTCLAKDGVPNWGLRFVTAEPVG